ncbi:hypothetical protein AL01_05520 [Bombella intestini]|uniref:GTP-binding protein Era n=1 Tax=Bombella intestini TaxID=1539051 RepID=A0A1S8GPD6_9PROT|nr:DUF1491 family protein [Bombella intestini]OOL18263.1 hypothetical protein AL01_05520 [Bombella intestini]
MFYGLKTGFWVRATLRHLNQNGLVAVLAHKGDEDAGSVFIVLNGRDGKIAVVREQGATWHRQAFEDNGEESAMVQATAYLERQKRYDPDLWIIEVDVLDSAHPLENEMPTRRFSRDD